jgi:WD40 repeat protein
MSWSNDRTDFDRSIAVIIGINDYQNGIHPLSTPVNDATVLANLLEKEYGYQEIVRLFPPYKEATLNNINELLTKTLPNQIQQTQGDRLLFYFAGHGIARNSEDGPAGYLIPQDAQLGKLETFLPMRNLNAALSQLDCHHLLVILDCCFAGNFRWSSTRNVIPFPETIHREHYDRFIRCSAWQAITSAAHNQEALDCFSDSRNIATNSHHSPFALALIEGLKNNKADLTGDEVITAPELYLYLRDRLIGIDGISELQTPGLWPLPKHDRGEFIFTLPSFKKENLTPAPPLHEDNNPYRGLKPFEEKHSRFFFGRKALVKALSHRLAQSHYPLTVVLGASGSGKSSLVQAGLLPHLREKQDKEQPAQRWYILDPMRPGKSPFRELARAFLPVTNSKLIDQLDRVSFLDKIFAEGLGDEAFDVTKLAECWNNGTPETKLLLVVDYFNQLQGFCHQPQKQQLDRLQRKINGILNRLTQELQQEEPQYFINLMARWSQKNPNTKLLLVIDQFEELITMSQDKRGSREQSDSQEQNEHKERQWFLSRLRLTLANYRQQLHIVLTLRSDFEPRFLNSTLKAYWKSARFPVRAMNSDELRDAIEGPALKQALYFEPPELVGKLIDEVGQTPGGLALLSFTLSELYIKLHERWTKDNATDRALRIQDYEELGGVAGALTRRATEEYDKFSKASGEAYQTTMRRVMLRMVAIEGGGVARRRVPIAELVYPDAKENKRVEDVIEQLVNVRLLVKGHEDKAQYVEPSHDLLIQGWGLLQEWIKDEQENLVLQNRLAAPTLDWNNAKDSAEDPDQFLWKQDPRIELLENIAKSENNWLNKLELDFVQACLDLRDKQARERLEKEVELNTTESQMLFTANDRIYAIVKLIEMGKILQSNLRKGLKTTEHKQLYFIIKFNQLLSELGELNSIDIGEPVINCICNQKTQIIATVSGQHNENCRLWDWKGNRIKFENKEESIYDLAFSPDGNVLVTAGEDGIIRFYRRDLRGYYSLDSTIDNPKKHSSQVIYVDFSPKEDEKLLVSVGMDRNINFWNWDGHFVMALTTHHCSVGQIAFSPKDKLIAFTDNDDNKKNVIKIWEYQDRKKLIEIDTRHNGEISAIAFSPDGETLVSGHSSGSLLTWPIRKDLNEPQFLMYGKDESGVSDVAFSPDGKIVASSHVNGIINLWDASCITFSKKLQKLYKLAGHKNRISKISFILDSFELLSSSYDKTVKLWSFKDKFKGYLGTRVQQISFSADNRIVTTIDEYGNLKLWSSKGELEKELNDDKSKIYNAQLSHDNEIIVAIGTHGGIKLYSKGGEMMYSSTDKYEQLISLLSRSPKEDIFLTASNDSTTVDIWKLNRDPLNIELLNILTVHHEQTTAITFSGNGMFFALGSAGGTVKLWNLDSNQASKTISFLGGSIVHLSLSEDGSMICVVDDKDEIKLYSRSNGIIHLQGRESKEKIYALTFYDEDKLIVSINKSGYIDIWSVDATYRLGIKALDEQALDKKFETAAFSSNGEEIAIATCLSEKLSNYRRIQILNLNLNSLIETACKRIRNYLEYKNWTSQL